MSLIGEYKVEAAICNGVILKGSGVRYTGLFSGDNYPLVISVTSGIIHGVAASLGADGDQINIYPVTASARVAVVAAITDLSLPLKITINGYFTPVTTDKDAYCLIPKQLSASGTAGTPSFIEAFVAPGYYAV